MITSNKQTNKNTNSDDDAETTNIQQTLNLQPLVQTNAQFASSSCCCCIILKVVKTK
jgi:hypothetical protein